MSLFEELRDAYRLSQDTYRDYLGESLAAAETLVREFRAYLGTPETYTDPEDDTRRPYVRLLSYQVQDGAPVAAPPESHADIMSRESDGFWRFALVLTLDRDAATFPKQNLAFFLRLKIHDRIWHVQLLEDGGYRDFPAPAAGASGREPLFGHMVGMVRRLLAAKPWDGVEKLPIGFELHRPDPPAADPAPPPAAP